MVLFFSYLRLLFGQFIELEEFKNSVHDNCYEQKIEDRVYNVAPLNCSSPVAHMHRPGKIGKLLLAWQKELRDGQHKTIRNTVYYCLQLGTKDQSDTDADDALVAQKIGKAIHLTAHLFGSLRGKRLAHHFGLANRTKMA